MGGKRNKHRGIKRRPKMVFGVSDILVKGWEQKARFHLIVFTELFEDGTVNSTITDDVGVPNLEFAVEMAQQAMQEDIKLTVGRWEAGDNKVSCIVAHLYSARLSDEAAKALLPDAMDLWFAEHEPAVLG